MVSGCNDLIYFLKPAIGIFLIINITFAYVKLELNLIE